MGETVAARSSHRLGDLALCEQIEVGMAEVYRGAESGNPYKVQYQAAEEVARAVKKGMWVLGDHYESPRAYRKRVGIS
jgi:endonuclease YncB( thermonuclease family)